MLTMMTISQCMNCHKNVVIAIEARDKSTFIAWLFHGRVRIVQYRIQMAVEVERFGACGGWTLWATFWAVSVWCLAECGEEATGRWDSLNNSAGCKGDKADAVSQWP